MSHSLSVLSLDPERASKPLGEKAHALTQYECPVKVRSSFPVSTSHSLSVLSSDPERASAPLGEKA